MKNKVSKVLNNEVYLLLLTSWLLINSIRFVSLSKVSQIVSIGFGIWGVLILVKNLFFEDGSLLSVSGVGFGVVFILTVGLSFVGNGLSAPVKNIYTIVAVCINFLIIYTSPFLSQRGFIRKVLIIVMLGTLVLNVINLVLLLFRYTYIIGDLDNIREATFIGFDSLRGRFTGLSGNANGLSRLGLNGLLASSTLIILGKNEKRDIVAYVSLVINTLVVLLAQSRGSIYALSLAFGVAIPMYLYLKLKSLKRQNLLINIGIIALVVIVAFSSLKALDKVSYTLVEHYPSIEKKLNNDKPSSGEDSNDFPNFDLSGRDDEATNQDFSNGRLTLMKNGINATLDSNPIFGLSYAGATSKIQKYIMENEISLPTYLFNSSGQMHNTFVQSFVYYGFLGLSALCLFFIYILVSFIKFVVGKMTLTEDQIKRFSVITFTLAVMVAMNMIEWVFVFDFDNHLINLLFFLVLGSLMNELTSLSSNLVSCKIDEKIRLFLKKIF